MSGERSAQGWQGREMKLTDLFAFFFPSWQTGHGEMGVHLAPEFCLVFHCTQLQQAPLGKVVPGDVCLFHAVDRSLLLRDGVDGRCIEEPVAVRPVGLCREKNTLSQRGRRVGVSAR